MPAKLTTTLKNIGKKVDNDINKNLITQFYDYLVSIDTSESYQNGLLKVIIRYAEYLGPSTTFYQIIDKEQIIKFLDQKKKTQEEDPDKKWITTWNDYLWRIKYFYRWIHNAKENDGDSKSIDRWITPSFINIKMKRTKRLSPYLETEIWDRDELFTIIKYEQYKRNKAVLDLLWDVDARPHEIALLQIKHIRLNEQYGEGEIPHESKTGSGPALLTSSFPCVRDWLNEHPFKNEPQARLICNLLSGTPIRADQINEIMKQLKKRIERLLENGEITNKTEKEKLEYILKIKKWNPYCIRHSAITADSDYLPEYALKKKVRWSMNSKQGSRYIKKRIGNELINNILENSGISTGSLKKQKPSVLTCPKCDLVNTVENKYCSRCSYPLSLQAFEEIKQNEETRFKALLASHKEDINILRKDMENKLQHIILKIDFDKVVKRE